MDEQEYCRRLLRYRDNRIPVIDFLGGKWAFMKGVLLAMGAFLLSSESTEMQVLGGFAFGYALGKIAVGLQTYRGMKAAWPSLRGVVDWSRVSQIAGRGDE